MRVLVIVLLLSIAGSVSAVELSHLEEAWFKPSLTLSGDNAVCGELLTDVTNHFLSNDLGVYIHWGYQNGVLGSVSRQKILLPNVSSPVSAFKISINNEENIYTINENYKSSGHPYSTLRGISLDKAEVELNDVNIKNLKRGDILKIYPIERFGDPYVRLVGINNSFYLITQDYSGKTISGYRFNTNKTLEKICSINTIPDSLGNNLVSFSKLKNVANNMLASSGGKRSCGTLNSHYFRSKGMEASFYSAMYRPWAINNDIGGRFETLTESLMHWGTIGLWNYEIFKDYKLSYGKAISGLADFYTNEFGMSEVDALKTSESQVKSALLRGLSGGVNFNDNYNLANAILEGQGLDTIKKYFDSERQKNGYKESILSIAISKPEIIEFLLKNGVNPNHYNVFGKTPLMYAAQYNEIKTAEYLLKYKAEVNAKTHDVSAINSCHYTINKFKVSALHYAIRYSSFKFIKLLIDNGAEIFAEDSDDKTPSDWLDLEFSHNEILTKDQIKQIKGLLAVTPAMLNEAKKLNVLGEKYYHNKNYEEAYSKFLRSSKLDRTNVRALNNLAVTAIKVDKLGEAVKYSDRVIKIKPKKSKIASAYYNYGKVCEKIRFENKQDPAYLKFEGNYYCTFPVLYYYLKAHEARPTKTRAETVVKNMLITKGIKRRHSCTQVTPNDVISAYHVGYDLYLLASKMYQANDYTFRKRGKSGAPAYSNVPLVVDREVDLYEDRKLIVLTSNGEFVGKTFDHGEMNCSRGLDSFSKDEPVFK